jgi:hypothetical protein
MEKFKQKETNSLIREFGRREEAAATAMSGLRTPVGDVLIA